MQRKYWISAIGLILLGFVIGSLAFAAAGRNPGYIPPLNVIGDVERALKLEEPKQLGKLHKISFEGQKYQALKLTDIIEAAQARGVPEQIYLISYDGFASAFPALGLEESYIAFTAKNGWEAINFNHPINSNAKMLKDIVIVSGESSSPFDLAVIDAEKELARVTPGRLYTRSLLEYPYAEGQAEIKKQGKTYTSSVYTRRKVFRLDDLTPVQEGARMLLMGADGENRYQENHGYFEVKDNYINYLDFDERQELERIRGVIIDPPVTSITDIYYDARHYLENEEKVLLLILDGLTYSLYKDALEKGLMPFLKNSTPALKAVGVYPLESNVWLAAMISGAAPEENGVVSKEQRNLKMPSLLELAKQGQKQALLLQAGPKLLNTETEAELIEKSADKTADKELYSITLDRLEQGYELLIVRFQDIADSTALYGEKAEATKSALAATDQYLEEIANNWAGKVIISGSPGSAAREFNCDTMFVPYLNLK